MKSFLLCKHRPNLSSLLVYKKSQGRARWIEVPQAVQKTMECSGSQAAAFGHTSDLCTKEVSGATQRTGFFFPGQLFNLSWDMSTTELLTYSPTQWDGGELEG